MVGFNEVYRETNYLALTTNFVIYIKQAFRKDKMVQETIKDLADSNRNIYNKKHWLEIYGLLVRKENQEKVYVPMLFRKTIKPRFGVFRPLRKW